MKLFTSPVMLQAYVLSTEGSKQAGTGNGMGVELIEDLIGKHDVEAFLLEIEGQLLKSNWKCEKSYLIDDDIKHSIVELVHLIRPVRVKVHTRIDGSRFIERWLEITKEGDMPSALSRVYPISGMLWRMREIVMPIQETFHKVQATRESTRETNESIFSAGYFENNQWGYEGDFNWRRLDNGTFTITSRSGRSGWGVPFFMIRNEINGEYFAAHLEWSCNWEVSFTVDQNPHRDEAMLFFKIGPAAPAVVRVIEPGETVVTPRVHLEHLKGNFDDCVQDIHYHLRKSVFFKDQSKALLFGRGRVVTGNTEWLKRQVDIAFRLSMQYFFIDAGWYGYTNNNWFDTVGDWNVGEWLDNNLDEIREYIHSKGMLFGIWMERETAGALSKIKNEHPDWFAALDGIPVSEGRLIDISKPEAA